MEYQNYQVVQRYNIANLETRVNEDIKKGWKPLGGIQMVILPDVGQVFLQAMARNGRGKVNGHRLDDES